MRKNIFHSAEIGGIQFQALISADGPYIQSSPLDGVAIGPSSICEIAAEDGYFGRHEQAGWWVVKHENQPRIYLPNFDDEKAIALSKEFGIPFAIHDPRFSEGCSFDMSPAWASLVQWVGNHPRLAKQYSGFEPYMAGWYERAKQENERGRGAIPRKGGPRTGGRRGSREIKEPACLGEGPISNSTEGGHAILIDFGSFPRWVVSMDPGETILPYGVIVDLEEGSTAQWFVVEKGDALIKSCSAGIGLTDSHLVVMPPRSINTRTIVPGNAIGMIPAILDFLCEPWRSED